MRTQTTTSCRLRALALAGVLALVSLPMPVDAQPQGASAPPLVVAPGAAAVPVVVRTHAATIVGSAWNADNSPIPNARLRLRNVQTGRLEGTTVANEAGEFRFAGIEPGSYVVELVSDTGKILTVGHPFTMGPGETVATFVRLGAKAPWYNGFFGNAAMAVATAAAATGLTALAPEQIRPVSGRQ